VRAGAIALCASVFVAVSVSGCAKNASNGDGASLNESEAHARFAGRYDAGDVERGHAIFETNCSTCHGSGGRSGGVGPSLVGESERQDLARTIAWIENPDPPMPKLYPSPLSERDVADVAAYVQSIK
jgi:mono/diheme cytochrome c family protein